MNWPIWWCTKEPIPCADVEMASWLCRVRSHLDHFCEE
jgi:hypothetical protein